MRSPALAFVFLAGLPLVVAPGCSARSIVIGGDPLGDGEGAASGTSSGGTTSGGGAGASGSTPASTGGTIPIGGSSGSTGGTIAIGGSSGSTGGTNTSTGGSTDQGGADGGEVLDPYPRVSWEEGQGYRRSCPSYDGTWGFTCWNHDGENTRGCRLSGDPYCNACMCAVPCETGSDCPPGITGHEADCVESATTTPSCFLVCDDEPCPTGMECTKYPGADRFVCMWLSERPFGQPPL